MVDQTKDKRLTAEVSFAVIKVGSNGPKANHVLAVKRTRKVGLLGGSFDNQTAVRYREQAMVLQSNE